MTEQPSQSPTPREYTSETMTVGVGYKVPNRTITNAPKHIFSFESKPDATSPLTKPVHHKASFASASMPKLKSRPALHPVSCCKLVWISRSAGSLTVLLSVMNTA